MKGRDRRLSRDFSLRLQLRNNPDLPPDLGAGAPQLKVDCIDGLEGDSIVHREYSATLCGFKISHTDNSFHFVLLAGREIHGKIGDVAGFDADHLHPFVIRKI